MNIIVTGASRGIGYELVKTFVKGGNNVVIGISRNKKLLEKLVEECTAINKHAQVIGLPFDLTDFINDPSLALSNISSHCGHADILVNNAGCLINKAFKDTDAGEAKLMFDANFFGPAFLIKSLLGIMGNKFHTHIINISSMGGFQGSSKYPGLSYYSAGKGALSVLTECLAEEFKDMNISVNCLALGAVQTEMLSEAFPGYKASLSATEMAEYIADFCINGHRYFNGRIIPVALSNP